MSVPTVTTMIINEMRDNLGHEPTQEEMNSLSEYLAQKPIKYFVDLELAIVDWKNTFTIKCDWCDDRYLPSEMIDMPGGEHFCDTKCMDDYEQEHGVSK